MSRIVGRRGPPTGPPRAVYPTWSGCTRSGLFCYSVTSTDADPEQLFVVSDPPVTALDRVVGLSPLQIQRRFTAAARAAGIEARVTAHSGRVGLASELTARGASTTEVMLAGNWKTARMVAHYCFPFWPNYRLGPQLPLARLGPGKWSSAFTLHGVVPSGL